jgi:hypothetical protein
MTDARTIQALKAWRRHVNNLRLNVIACQVWRGIADVTDPDADLMAALEAFRQGQLAKIGAQLARFGIEPPAQETEEQKPRYLPLSLP